MNEITPSATDPVVYGALVNAQRAVRPLEKDAFNRFHNYRYASSEAVIDEGRKALNKGGLALFCIGWGLCERAEQERVQLKKNSGERVLVIKWIWGDYILAHESGATTSPMRYEVAAVLESGRPDDKAIAGALTLQLAYVLRQILLIPRQDKSNTDANRRDDRGSQQPKHRDRVRSGLDALKDLHLGEKRLLAHLKIKDKSKIGKRELVAMRELFVRLGAGESVDSVLGRAKEEGTTTANVGQDSPAAQGGKDAPGDSPPPPDDRSAPPDDWEAEARRDLE